MTTTNGNIIVENIKVGDIHYEFAYGCGIKCEVLTLPVREKADSLAFERACAEYESYAGSNGLRDIEEIMEEDGITDDDEAWQTFAEEREGWIEYSARPYTKAYEKEVKPYHYDNPFKEITDQA